MRYSEWGLKDQGLNQSKLAEKIDVSRVKVYQVLSLLKLPKTRQEYILQYGKELLITEIQLRVHGISSQWAEAS